ncbi:permease [Clostridium acetobutylicum]|nr:permease [Clostridium acetobutylicum]
MNKLLHLFLLDTKLLLKSKVFYLKLVLFPIAIILIIGAINGKNENTLKVFNVAYYSADTGYQSLNVSKNLSDNVFKNKDIKKIINLKKVRSYAEAKELVSNGTASALVYVPTNFTKDYLNGNNVEISVVGDNNKINDVSIVKTIVNSFNENISTIRAEQNEVEAEVRNKAFLKQVDIDKLIKSIENTNGISAKISKVASKSGVKPLDIMQYEIFAMVVMFSIITAFELTQNIVSDKLNNTMNRIKSTATSNFQYILSKIIGMVIAIIVQMVTVMVISSVVFRVKYDNIPGIILITVVYGFSIGSIVVCAGLFAKDHMSVSSVMSPIVWGFSFLGGSLFDKNNFSDVLACIQRIIPNGKAINCYLEVCEGNSIGFIYKDLLELLGISVVFVLIALMLSSKDKRIRLVNNNRNTLVNSTLIK